MNTFLQVISYIGLTNSALLIVYIISRKQGGRSTNYLFAALILVLSLSVLKPVAMTFFETAPALLLRTGLFCLGCSGPLFYLIVSSIIQEEYRFDARQLLHFIPAAFLLAGYILSYNSFPLIIPAIYKLFLLHQIVYYALAYLRFERSGDPRTRQTLFPFVLFLLLIWLFLALEATTSLPYIATAVVYAFIIYLSILLVVNRNFSYSKQLNGKYLKTGLRGEERERIISELNRFLDVEKIYRENTISLSKLAKRINASVHAVSQVLNEHYSLSFFQLIRQYRIREAKRIILEDNQSSIQEIAYQVGFNSISSFNTSFKQAVGMTPMKFRDGTEPENTDTGSRPNDGPLKIFPTILLVFTALALLVFIFMLKVLFDLPARSEFILRSQIIYAAAGLTTYYFLNTYARLLKYSFADLKIILQILVACVIFILLKFIDDLSVITYYNWFVRADQSELITVLNEIASDPLKILALIGPVTLLMQVFLEFTRVILLEAAWSATHGRFWKMLSIILVSLIFCITNIDTGWSGMIGLFLYSLTAGLFYLLFRRPLMLIIAGIMYQLTGLSFLFTV